MAIIIGPGSPNSALMLELQACATENGETSRSKVQNVVPDSGAAVHSADCSLDPKVCEEWIGDIVLRHRFFNGKFWGRDPKEFNTSREQELFDASSPIMPLTQDDPPVWGAYGIPKEPLDITSATLKERMDQLGGAKRGEVSGPMPFLLKHLGVTPKPTSP